MSSEGGSQDGAKVYYAVDGNLTNLAHTTNTLRYSEWFVVDLINAYQVQYITLYNRKNCSRDCLNTSIRGNYDLCGIGPDLKYAVAFQPFNVTCNNRNKFSRFVIIQQSLQIEQAYNTSDRYVHFSELEVYADDTILQYNNVALRKPAYMSSFNSSACSPNNCLDGEKTTYCLLAHSPSSSTIEEWFVVDLKRQYQVQYVALYARTDCCSFVMDYFVVGLANKFNTSVNAVNRGTYDPCGSWATTVNLTIQPMRVECRNKNNYYRYVIIQQDASNKAINMTFAELEVYGVESPVYNYKGCYESFQVQSIFYEFSSLDVCVNLCKDSKTLYATIKDSLCLCGTSSDLLPSSSCFENCDGSGICPETSFYAVYTTSISPGYMGCYTDVDYVDSNSASSRTIENCFQYCLGKNFSYANLQNSRECYCGYLIGNHALASNCGCNSYCDGNAAEMCGGVARKNSYSRK
ncbi:hypothetical protein HELRODRAFT_163135 [Helobdella robusta]|uniref:WSC domain-containing protein n=1 Tax=Helobdella robusta TaxID=6412 RepID=T1ETP6_HELRO|nr:hypothetical protein HELRODRAFT_163135 [Helobdella robusta]ESN96107.1 hypothetical protein HELRODRAFT_163135 [Helobdella robusta]